MSNVSNWSNTATGNNTAAPDGFPEGMLPSGVNDAAREVMAAIRRWYEDAQWIDLGITHTRTGASTFTISGDYTATYTVGRRVKMTGSATAYGTISASSYVAPDTTVTISESNVPATLATVSVGILSPTNGALPNRVPGLFTVTAPSSGQTLSTSIVAGSSGGNIVTDGTVTGYTRTTAATSLNFGTNSAHALNLVTNDTTRASVSSAGNFTINAPGSGTALTVGAIPGNAAAVFGSKFSLGDDHVFLTGANLVGAGNNSLGYGTAGSGSAILFTNSQQRVTANSTGNVSVNAPSSGSTLNVSSLTGLGNYVASSTGATGTLVYAYNLGLLSNAWNIYSSSTDPLQIGTAGAASVGISTNSVSRFFISAAGNVTVNAPSSGVSMTVNAPSAGSAIALGDGTVSGTLNFGGTVLQVGTTSSHGVQIATGNTSRIAVGAAGNVTVNAPSSGATLSLATTAALGGAAVQMVESGVRSWQIRAGGLSTDYFDIADITRGQSVFSISSTGNVNIAAPSSGFSLQVNSPAAGTAIGFSDGTVTGWAADFGATRHNFGTSSAHSSNWYSGNSQRVSLSAAGNVTVNSPDSGYAFAVSGETNARGVALTAYKTATTTRTTATPSNDPHLVIAIPAAGTYAVEVFVRLNPDGPGGAGGFLWGLNYSGSYTATESYISSNGMINAAAQIEGTAQVGSSAATGIWFRTAILSGDWVQLRGTLTATSSGNLGFNWSQNSAAGNLTLTAGAYMKATKLS